MTLEKSATLEPTESDMTVPRIANQRRYKIEEERLPLREAGIEQDKKIAQLMRNLVKNHREGSRNANVKTDDVRGADYGAIDKIVGAVSH